MSKSKADDLIASFSEVHTGPSFTRSEFMKFAEDNGFGVGVIQTALNRAAKLQRGLYTLNVTNVKPLFPSAPPTVQPTVSPVQSTSVEDVYVPTKDDTFVEWGHFNDVMTILKTQMFYPIFITGLSGNGKTIMVEQACAQLNREYIRVQISPETDEDDLIGGFRLINGETVFAKGPVIKAMEAGAVLLIDEIDRGSNKLMALQGVLEGKPILIKKTGEVIQPRPGFTVIGTANTKGQGSEDGRFISASIIDEAFLERFTITLEQPYADEGTEKTIVVRHMHKYSYEDIQFAELLTKWSTAIRKTHDDGGVDELISTRRLCHIVQTYSIFRNRSKAIELCVARFDADTRTAFVDLYSKIDVAANSAQSLKTNVGKSDYRDPDDRPF